MKKTFVGRKRLNRLCLLYQKSSLFLLTWSRYLRVSCTVIASLQSVLYLVAEVYIYSWHCGTDNFFRKVVTDIATDIAVWLVIGYLVGY